MFSLNVVWLFLKVPCSSTTVEDRIMGIRGEATLQFRWDSLVTPLKRNLFLIYTVELDAQRENKT